MHRLLLAGAVFLAMTTFGRAQISLDYAISDSFIEVGETFTVDVVMKGFTSDFDLYSYAFDVDPFETLGHVSHVGTEIPAWGTDLGGFDVNVDVFPELTGGADITLATLNFQAITVGLDTLSLLGNDGLDTGIFYGDYSNDPVFGEDGYFAVNDSSFQISVQAVPEPSTYSMIGMAVLFLGIVKRKRAKRLKV